MSDSKKSDVKAQMVEITRQIEASPTKKLQKTTWEDTAIDVPLARPPSFFGRFFASGPQKSARVAAKKSSYLVPYHVTVAEIAVCVFVTDQGAIWLGPTQDFYIETGIGVVGGRKLGHGMLWTESMVNKRANEKSDVHSVITRFEKEVAGNSLVVAYNGGPGAPSEVLLKRLTNLAGVFRDIYAPSTDEGADIASVQAEGNTARLDLKGYSGESSGTVWIDIKSKRLLKAEENGKQVFPK